METAGGDSWWKIACSTRRNPGFSSGNPKMLNLQPAVSTKKLIEGMVSPHFWDDFGDTQI